MKKIIIKIIIILSIISATFIAYNQISDEEIVYEGTLV